MCSHCTYTTRRKKYLASIQGTRQQSRAPPRRARSIFLSRIGMVFLIFGPWNKNTLLLRMPFFYGGEICDIVVVVCLLAIFCEMCAFSGVIFFFFFFQIEMCDGTKHTYSNWTPHQNPLTVQRVRTWKLYFLPDFS